MALLVSSINFDDKSKADDIKYRIEMSLKNMDPKELSAFSDNISKFIDIVNVKAEEAISHLSSGSTVLEEAKSNLAKVTTEITQLRDQIDQVKKKKTSAQANVEKSQASLGEITAEVPVDDADPYKTQYMGLRSKAQEIVTVAQRIDALILEKYGLMDGLEAKKMETQRSLQTIVSYINGLGSAAGDPVNQPEILRLKGLYDAAKNAEGDMDVYNRSLRDFDAQIVEAETKYKSLVDELVKLEFKIDEQKLGAKAAADKAERDAKAAADKAERDAKAAADKAERDAKAAAATALSQATTTLTKKRDEIKKLLANVESDLTQIDKDTKSTDEFIKGIESELERRLTVSQGLPEEAKSLMNSEIDTKYAELKPQYQTIQLALDELKERLGQLKPIYTEYLKDLESALKNKELDTGDKVTAKLTEINNKFSSQIGSIPTDANKLIQETIREMVEYIKKLYKEISSLQKVERKLLNDKIKSLQPKTQSVLKKFMDATASTVSALKEKVGAFLYKPVIAGNPVGESPTDARLRSLGSASLSASPESTAATPTGSEPAASATLPESTPAASATLPESTPAASATLPESTPAASATLPESTPAASVSGPPETEPELKIEDIPDNLSGKTSEELSSLLSKVNKEIDRLQIKQLSSDPTNIQKYSDLQYQFILKKPRIQRAITRLSGTGGTYRRRRGKRTTYRRSK